MGRGTPRTSSDATPVVDSTADSIVPMNDARAPDPDARAGGSSSGMTVQRSAGTNPIHEVGYDLGGGGWGVMQLQTYTSDAANAAPRERHLRSSVKDQRRRTRRLGFKTRGLPFVGGDSRIDVYV